MTRAKWLGAVGLLGALAATVVLTVPEYREQLRQVRVRLAIQPFYAPARFDLYPLDGCSLDQPTSLTFGPDDRLYVAEVGGTIVEVSVSDGDRARAMAALSGAVARGEGIAVPAPDGVAALPRVLQALDRVGVTPELVGLRRPSLDDVFLAVTGRAA